MTTNEILKSVFHSMSVGELKKAKVNFANNSKIQKEIKIELNKRISSLMEIKKTNVTKDKIKDKQ